MSPLGAGERLVREPGGDALRIALPRCMPLRGGRTWSSGGGAAPARPKIHPLMVDALHRAHLMAADDRVQGSVYDRKIVALALLAPAVQAMTLEGRQPVGLTLAKLQREPPPLLWREQAGWMEGLAEQPKAAAFEQEHAAAKGGANQRF